MLQKIKLFSKSILFKILLVFVVFLMPVYLLLFALTNNYIKALEEQTVSAVQSDLDLNMSNLSAEISRINVLIYSVEESDTNYLTLGKNIDQITVNDFSLAVTGLHKKLYNEINGMQYGTCMFFYQEEQDYLQLVFTTDQSDRESSLEENLREHDMWKEIRGWELRKIEEEYYMIHTFRSYGVTLGAMIPMEVFIDSLLEQMPQKSCVIALDPWEEAALREEGIEKPITITCPVTGTEQDLYVYIDQNEIYESFNLVQRLLSALVFLSVLLLPLLWLLFWELLVKPLKRIEKGIHKLGSGQQDYRIPVFKSSSEYVSMSRDFNSMADEIRNLKIESYEKELEKEKMLLANLSLQVHPHFLLNTFNQIFSMAQLRDYESIQTMALYLSKYFRYLFHSQETDQLKNELALVRSYIEIMELRYVGCFEVDWDVDEGLLKAEVPPLLIHNFVENIFKYAVIEGNETTIYIGLHRNGDFAEIRIEDDGPGMEENILQQIREGKPIDKNDGTHIGIYNSNYRLKAFCGEKAYLKVESVPAEGTKVVIGLPIPPQEGRLL